MNNQMEAAQKAMVEWLANERELGKVPAKIQCEGTFSLHDMTYYMFKYKKGLLGKWLLGVCGGYEEDSTEHCGHVFSEMQEYDPSTAQEKSIQMVETIRSFWMKEAERLEKAGSAVEEGDDDAEHSESEQNETGAFVSFILLDKAEMDFKKLAEDLKDQWDIVYKEEVKDDNLVFDVDGVMVAVSLMPAPVPGGEAVHNAKTNYMWPEAVEAAERHAAHIMVAVLGSDKAGLLERGKLYVKVCSACLMQKYASGIYTAGTVFQPEFYIDNANVMKEDYLPLMNWLYIGLFNMEKGIGGYTYGMKVFGKDELEVLESRAKPQELHSFLLNICDYILSSDVTLKDGETIGFSAEQKLPIQRSKGVSLEGDTLKIGFEPA